MQPWAQENANVHRGELSTRISFSYACAVLISLVRGKNSSCACHHCEPTLVLISQVLTSLTVYFGWKEITTINDFLLELHLVLCCILTLSTPSNSFAASWHDWLGRSEAKRLTNSRINLETEQACLSRNASRRFHPQFSRGHITPCLVSGKLEMIIYFCYDPKKIINARFYNFYNEPSIYVYVWCTALDILHCCHEHNIPSVFTLLLMALLYTQKHCWTRASFTLVRIQVYKTG